MKFIDKSQILVRAGDGGNGISSFRRARNLPKLGPDGGNGGHGGDVYIIGEANLNTLSSLRYKQIYKAEAGVRGGSNCKTGACGDHLYIPVPIGTVAIKSSYLEPSKGYEEVEPEQTEEILGEILEPGQKIQVAKGGKRGYGNYSFLSATHQAPHEWTAGEAGEKCTISLELKLLADIGLAGFPNAGKSTLLSRISSAKPKIGAYPFTTLSPMLGLVHLKDSYDQSFVVADIPGLIEGASQGKGLGHEFLKHIERTRAIAYVIDPFDYQTEGPWESFVALKKELESYEPTLAKRKSMVVLNKADLTPEGLEEDILAPFKENGVEAHVISGVSGQGIDSLIYRFYDLVKNSSKEANITPDASAIPTAGKSLIEELLV